MKEKIKHSLMLINTDLNRAKELEAIYRHNQKNYSYWQGRRQALEESLKLFTNILNYIPDRFKVYQCTDCQEVNVKKDNRQITVGLCDNCNHPLWNDDVK